ncbi:MAG: hypothetical protein FJX65_06455 [Alphaproteobacteria bacterium]|nr:hypothetical protein [Alphaproteobacteria bacterium]
MSAAFVAVLSILAIAALGWFLTKRSIVPEAFWSEAQRLNYFVFIPSLFFYALASADLSAIPVAWIIVSVAATLGAGAVLFEVWRTGAGVPPADVPTLGECAVRANVPMGFAIVLAFVGPYGLGAFAIAAMTYLPSVILIGGVLQSRTLEGEDASKAFPLPAFQLIARNPIVIGALAGLAWHLTGDDLPDSIAAAFSVLGYAAMALGVLAAGAAFDPNLAVDAATTHRRTALPLIGIKLIALPIIAASFAILFEANSPAVVGTVLLAALAPVVPRFTTSTASESAATVAKAVVCLALVVAAVTMPLTLWALT